MENFKEFCENTIIEMDTADQRKQWTTKLNQLLKEYGLRKKEKAVRSRTTDDTKRNYWNRSENELTMEIEVDPGNAKILKITRGPRGEVIKKIKSMIDDIKNEFNESDTAGGHLKQLYLEKDSLGLLIGQFA